MPYRGCADYNNEIIGAFTVNLLAIDTSTHATVLGLAVGDRVLDRTTEAKNSHSREVLPLISAMVSDAGLALSDIDALVFGQGPGSFTGLRIAAGVVQGLGYGLKIPVVQVSTMACLAQAAASEPDHQVFVALTARLEEIYFGAYAFEAGMAIPIITEGVLDVSELPKLPAGQWTGMGNAWALRQKIEQATGITLAKQSDCAVPRVDDLLRLGRHGLSNGLAVDAVAVSPVYLREEVASKPAVKAPLP